MGSLLLKLPAIHFMGSYTCDYWLSFSSPRAYSKKGVKAQIVKRLCMMILCLINVLEE